MDLALLEKLAERLREARNTGVPIEPISKVIGTSDHDAAYFIQNINTNYKLHEDVRIIGRKIGLTSKRVQAQIGVTEPDYGILFNDMEILNGSQVSMSQLMQPKVEAEIVFVLKNDLKMENMVLTDVINAIDYVLGSIEIVGSRIRDWQIAITDTIADNASSSHFVLAHKPVKLDNIDLLKTSMQMFKNTELVVEGKGSDCLGSPLNAVLWLANKMVEREQPLRKGDVILSGALAPMVNVKGGDVIKVEFDTLGVVEVEFTP